VGKRGCGGAGWEVRLTGFVEFENQNKQSFQCQDTGDKFFHVNGLGIYTVLAVNVCLSVCMSALHETKHSGTLSVLLSAPKTNLYRKMK
jgi:hypothetical protein